ncbi:MAG TPA: ATP-binding protein [Polyangia bacterium]|nr:ATP-binding protein [Polyangia bacterium]
MSPEALLLRARAQAPVDPAAATADGEAGAGEGGARPDRRHRMEAMRTVQYLMLFRVALSTLLFVAVVSATVSQYGGEALSGPFPRFAFGLLFSTYLASLLYGLTFKRVRDPIRFGYLQIAVDLALASVLVHATGGGNSGFIFLYFIDVVAVALLAQRRGAAVVAGISAFLIVGISLAGYGRWLPLVPGQTWLPWEISRGALAVRLTLNVSALAAVGALATHLASQTRQAGERLTRHERYAGDLATLHENTIRSLTSGLVTLDLDRRVTSVNDAACEILGIPGVLLFGASLDTHVPALAGVLSGLRQEATLRRAEITAVRPDSSVRNLGVSAAPLSDSAGKIVGRVLHFQDLTELRRMQIRVERAERLASIGRLAAGIAHEIRNPLASISGSMEMLKQSPGGDADSRQLMDIAVREVDRLNRLITDLLDYARPKTEERQRLDLGELVGEIARAFGQERRAGVTLTLQADPDVCLDGASGQLRQVVWNLVRNAAEAMPAGGAIRVRVTSEGGHPLLVVSDTGAGIPKAHLERIFEPFYSTKVSGSGLGLATVARIVDDHRGHIDVDSEPGRGTTFTVRFAASAAQKRSTPAAKKSHAA